MTTRPMTLRHFAAALALALAAPAGAALAQPQTTPGAQFMQNWDLNQDGTATLDELREMRGNVFLTFDSNEDGFLDAGEYVMFDQARANDVANYQGGRRAQMQRVADAMTLANADLDGDGRVSRSEFLDGTAGWFAALDKTGDGAITTADFGR